MAITIGRKVIDWAKESARGEDENWLLRENTGSVLRYRKVSSGPWLGLLLTGAGIAWPVFAVIILLGLRSPAQTLFGLFFLLGGLLGAAAFVPLGLYTMRRRNELVLDLERGAWRKIDGFAPDAEWEEGPLSDIDRVLLTYEYRQVVERHNIPGAGRGPGIKSHEAHAWIVSLAFGPDRREAVYAKRDEGSARKNAIWMAETLEVPLVDATESAALGTARPTTGPDAAPETIRQGAHTPEAVDDSLRDQLGGKGVELEFRRLPPPPSGGGIEVLEHGDGITLRLPAPGWSLRGGCATLVGAVVLWIVVSGLGGVVTGDGSVIGFVLGAAILGVPAWLILRWGVFDMYGDREIIEGPDTILIATRVAGRLWGQTRWHKDEIQAVRLHRPDAHPAGHPDTDPELRKAYQRLRPAVEIRTAGGTTRDSFKRADADDLEWLAAALRALAVRRQTP